MTSIRERIYIMSQLLDESWDDKWYEMVGILSTDPKSLTELHKSGKLNAVPLSTLHSRLKTMRSSGALLFDRRTKLWELNPVLMIRTQHEWTELMTEAVLRHREEFNLFVREGRAAKDSIEPFHVSLLETAHLIRFLYRAYWIRFVKGQVIFTD